MVNRRRTSARWIPAAIAIAALWPRASFAEHVSPPPVPGNLQAPAGARAFLVGHAVGTQNYICLPSGAGFAWTLFGPQATLFADNGRQIITHFLSPNPEEAGTPRATWQHSQDTTAVWARAKATSSDPAFVAPGAIPWLLPGGGWRTGRRAGGDRLIGTTAIQRLNTPVGSHPRAAALSPRTSARERSCRIRPTTSSTGSPAAPVLSRAP
jgi:hypothetical protein